jgi:putative ABC transport system permease protein
MIAAISWKNVWRNKTRSLVVIAAIAVGLAGGLFASATMKGMGVQRIKVAIANETSHIQLHNPAFMENKDIHDTIASAAALADLIAAMPEVKAVASRSRITAMASTATTGTAVFLNGIDPVKEKKVTGISAFILDSCGDYFAGNKKNSIVIGQKLAKKLKARLHSKIILTFQTEDGNITGAAFRVVGIYKTINTTFDEMNAYVRINDLGGLNGITGKPRIHEIAILLRHNEATDSMAQMLKRAYPQLSVMSWKEISPDLGMMTDFLDQMLYVIMIILMLALSFGIVNTMLMVVLERVKEIGMLMAIGMSRSRVFFMIMLETVFLSVTGGFAGISLGWLGIAWFARKGIDLSAFAQGMEAIGYSTMIYPALAPGMYLGLSLLVVLLGIVASIYPARKAVMLRPAEAIRTA